MQILRISGPRDGKLACWTLRKQSGFPINESENPYPFLYYKRGGSLHLFSVIGQFTGGSRIVFPRGAVKLVTKTGVQGVGPLAGVGRGHSPLA